MEIGTWFMQLVLAVYPYFAFEAENLMGSSETAIWERSIPIRPRKIPHW